MSPPGVDVQSADGAGHSTAAVAAIVTTYNQAHFVPEALHSIRMQKPGPQEVVVVDDGSSDDVASRLEGLEPAPRLIRQANRGVSAARNRGLEETSAPIVAFLDADDRWPAGFLAAALGALAGSPEAAAVILGYEPALETGAVLPENLPAPAPEGPLVFASVYEGNPVVSPSVAVIRRQALEAVGGFDDAVPLVGDYDLWLRLTLRFQVLHLPEPRVAYRVHATNASLLRWSAMVEQQLQVFQQLESRELPVSPATRRRRLARIHHAVAYNRLLEGRRREARREISRAIVGEPARVKNYVYWLASWLPTRYLRSHMAGATSFDSGAPDGS